MRLAQEDPVREAAVDAADGDQRDLFTAEAVLEEQTANGTLGPASRKSTFDQEGHPHGVR
jgi:hypothetical protein